MIKLEITLDWDSLPEPIVMQRLSLIKQLPYVRQLFYRYSASGKGWHIKANMELVIFDSLKDIGIKSFCLGIRAAWWDDPARIRCDVVRMSFNLPRQRLFDIKGGKKAGEWMLYV
jgi:hypothetical protein